MQNTICLQSRNLVPTVKQPRAENHGCIGIFPTTFLHTYCHLFPSQEDSWLTTAYSRNDKNTLLTPTAPKLSLQKSIPTCGRYSLAYTTVPTGEQSNCCNLTKEPMGHRSNCCNLTKMSMGTRRYFCNATKTSTGCHHNCCNKTTEPMERQSIYSNK